MGTDPSSKSGYTLSMTGDETEAGASASCNGVAAGSSVSTDFVGAAPTSGGGVR